MRNIAVLALAASLLGGCVSASKYRALETDFSSKNQELAQTRSKAEDLGKTLEAKNQELKAAADKLEEANKQLGAKQEALAKAQAQADELAKRIEAAQKDLKQTQAAAEGHKKAKDLIASRYQDHLSQTLGFLKLTKASIDKQMQELTSQQSNEEAGAEVKKEAGDSAPALEGKAAKPAPPVSAPELPAKKPKPASKEKAVDETQL